MFINFPKLIYKLNIITNKISAGLFAETDNLLLKFIMKFKVPIIAKRIYRKNKNYKFVLFDFKTNHKTVIMINTV